VRPMARKLDRSRIRGYTRKPLNKAPRVTVCIAALCSELLPDNQGHDLYVVCAGDRMMTAGVGGEADIEYEPTGSPKIFPVTSSIVLMWAGDAFIQREILLQMAPEVAARIQANPSRWLGVREVAELYSKHYLAMFRQRAEQEVFIRYGFDYDKFTNQNRDLAPSTIGSLVDDLRTFQAEYPGVWTLFAGLDPTGSHIYSALGSSIYCHDASGFAAIGTGARHASSQFMLARHSLKKPLAETLRLTYFAKKRSEVAPGVGSLTDMCLIGPALGSFQGFDQEQQIAELQSLYKESLADERRLLKRAQKGINAFVEKLKQPPGGQVVDAAATSGARASDSASATVKHPPTGEEPTT
jgi:hypothetical protein